MDLVEPNTTPDRFAIVEISLLEGSAINVSLGLPIPARTGVGNSSVVCVLQILESVFQAKLDRSWPVRVNGMQKRVASHAIGSGDDSVNSWTLESGGIVWAAVAADSVTAGVPEIGIVDAKLGVVEKIESLRAKFDVAAFPNGKMFQQTHIEVSPVRIVQKVAARVPKRQAARRHEAVGISQQRPEALGIKPVIWSRCGMRIHIRVGARPNAVGYASIVEN